MPWRCPVVDRDAPTVIEAVGIERVANGYQAMGERRAIKTLLRL
jgi:hypothetical protein